MGAKGTKNGQRKQYTLDDGQVVDVFVVAKRVNCSISLALARLNTSSDPDYIFMAKGTKLPDGHPYVKLERERKVKNGNRAKTDFKAKEVATRSFYDPLMRLVLKTI
tara:strand:+ start:568 stop:888 length:321 start_codon:yes stop_codon:yes gene_type:complete